jgi:predicted DNA-binding transcriptional regulator AlpA
MTTLLDDEFIGCRELAKIAGWHIATVHNRLSRGEDLPENFKLGKNVRFRKSDVIAWLEKHRRVPAAVQLQQQATA